jgi:hypothetical protein
MNWKRALVIWLLIVVAESISGTIRRIWLVPIAGEKASHQIGVLIGSMLILLIAWLSARWLDARTLKGQLQIGALWVVLIVAFEFGVGAAVGNSMPKMLAEYDFTQGGLMALGLIVMFFAPALGSRMAGNPPTILESRR